MTEILEIRMSVSAATGRIINGIDPIDNYDKVSYILKNAVDYTYDFKYKINHLILTTF